MSMEVLERESREDTDLLSEYYADLLEGTYDCVDRIVLRAYFPLGQTGGGFRVWWRSLHGTDENLTEERLRRMAGRFSRRVRAWAKKQDVPVLDCQRGDRKHLLAAEYLPADADFTGVFLILVHKAPAKVWKVERYGNGGLNLRVADPRPYVNHYSFHVMDPDWGHVTFILSGHPPWDAMIILNGHEWVERQAQKQGLEFVKDGNCFTGASSLADLDRVADTLNAEHSIGRLFQVCERWLYSACVCFAVDLADQERTGFRYQFSGYQLEYSRNLVFQRGRKLDEIYQDLLDRTRRTMDVPTLKTIFGRERRPYQHPKSKRRAPRLETCLETPTYDLTVYKLHFGKLTLKIYDKGERVLRIESIAHNVGALRCGKDIGKLPEMVSLLKENLVRFLNVVRYAHASFLEAEELDELPQPSQCGASKVAGINLEQSRMRAVAEAVLSLAPKPGGFTVGDLVDKVREHWRDSEEEYHRRKAAYDLKKLRGKGLVHRIDKTRRYRIDAAGFRVLAALLVLREKVLKPVLAGLHRRKGKAPRNTAPIDLHYQQLRDQLSNTLNELGLAA